MVKSVRISAGGRVSGEENRSFNVAGTSTFLSIACSTAEYLGIDDARWHTLLVIPDGEKLEGAVKRLTEEAGGWARALTARIRCGNDSNEDPALVKRLEDAVAAAEAELAGQQIITLEALQYLYKSGPPPTPVYAEGLCRVAIRRLEPEPKVTFWRRPGAWLENSVCASCGDTFRFSTSARKCPRCGAEGEPRDLPGQGECST